MSDAAGLDPVAAAYVLRAERVAARATEGSLVREIAVELRDAVEAERARITRAINAYRQRQRLRDAVEAEHATAAAVIVMEINDPARIQTAAIVEAGVPVDPDPRLKEWAERGFGNEPRGGGPGEAPRGA